MQEQAKEVLNKNKLSGSTKPAIGLYPHQWFWDSCFIAVGLRWIDISRAKEEVRSLLKGQWPNGMIPHIIFSEENGYHFGPKYWQSSKFGSPINVETSCLTQPPMLAEAIYKIGQKLENNERFSWYQETIPDLIKYHEWLYEHRTVPGSDLVSLIHPWECGMDNTPYWLVETRSAMPLKIKALKKLKLDILLNRFRKDTKTVPASQRPEPADLFTFYNIVKQAGNCDYNLAKIIEKSKIPIIEDLLFNGIFLRANNCLLKMAQEINYEVSENLKGRINNSFKDIKKLAAGNSYYSRNSRTGKLIEVDSVAEFMMLYSGSLTNQEARIIADKIKKGTKWWPELGIATVPVDSSWFLEKNYWRGPVWININWLIIEGLSRYGLLDMAADLADETIGIIENSKGFHEYYSALDGYAAGSKQFSWTAALYIDLINNFSS